METIEKTPEQELKEARDELALAQRRLAAAEDQIRAGKKATLDAMKPRFRELAAEFGKARAALYRYCIEVRRTCDHDGALVLTEDKAYCVRCTLGHADYSWPGAMYEGAIEPDDDAPGTP